MNVIDLEARRDHDLDAQNRDDVLAAMWHGIENSKWSKDANDPTAPPTLARFVKHVADEAPLSVLKMLLARYTEPPTNNE